MKYMYILLFSGIAFLLAGFAINYNTGNGHESIVPVDLLIEDSIQKWNIIDSSGGTILTRFNPPKGYERISNQNPFAIYLRDLKLFPIEREVHYYDGSLKSKNNVYCSVIDLPIGNRNLHQCADAVMNVRAHYLYEAEEFDKIHFNFTNGFQAKYAEWRKGKRIKIEGNSVSYYQTDKESTSYTSFLEYLQKVYCYAGTFSLDKELLKQDIDSIQPGNVFIKGGFPGHAVIVVDVASNSEGEKLFMLAQSYMPAQELQILINPLSDSRSPWFQLDQGSSQLITPEWIFYNDQLKRFAD